MNKLQRLDMAISVLQDARESVEKYERAQDGTARKIYTGFVLEQEHSATSICQRLDVARAAVLKVKKAMEAGE